MDLPIALRRTRRRASMLPVDDTAPPTPPLTPSTSSPATPSRRRSQTSTFTKSTKAKRRVRFSDPGPATPSSTSSRSSNLSTGITPMIRRTSLAFGLDNPSSPVTEATFLPLRQVIDGRIKRRLRRNGLSEEMNLIYDEQRTAKREKKTRAAAAQLELEQLRSDMAEKDREIERLVALQDNDNDITIMQDNGRIVALERELRILRNQLEGSSGVAEHHDRTSNWTMAARDPFVSSELTELAMNEDIDTMTEVMTDMGDDVFGDTTMAELQCSTPSRRRLPSPRRLDDSQATISCGDCNADRNAQSSFPTPPATSPAAWMPDPISPVSDAAPVTPTMHFFSTRRSVARPSTLSSVPSPLFSPVPTPSSVSTAEVDVQACLPDPETDALRDEVASLYRETAKLNAALESYQSLVKVVGEKIATAEVPSSSSATLDEQVTLVLRALSDKTVALAHLSKSLAALGFTSKEDKQSGRQSDASDVVANLASTFRTARLELEYLTPGEIELPLTAPAAQILDLLLGRLRTLSTNAREAEARVDEYREIEASLKEQLAARVSAMDELKEEVVERDSLIEQKNTMLAEKNAMLSEKESLLSTQGEAVVELEVGLDRLKGAVASYARDMAELEALVQRLEKELAASKDDTEKKKELLDRRAAATLALNQNHGRALALRDARVHELRGEIEQVNDALRAAHDTSRQLRVDNAGMAAALDAEKQRAQSAVATLQAELTRISQLGKDLLGPVEDKASNSRKRMTPGRRVSLGKSTTVAEAEKDSRKRRRYDSGLGFLDEDEEDMF